MASLQNVQAAAHVSFAELDKGVGGFGCDVHAFFLDHLVHQSPNIRLFQRTESKPRTSRQQCWGEFVSVVRDDAESRVGGIFLHDPSERHLCGRGHSVGFVEDDEFVLGHGGCRGRPIRGCRWTHAEYLFRRSEGLDLFSHDVDASVVGSVQL